VLADAAKYDASCASSGAPKRHAAPGQGTDPGAGPGMGRQMGSTTGMGICHSYAPDGRCVSLLKILLTNFCLYDCLYCVNRRSSDVPRARFTVEEVVDLTLPFYRRNYIEGLFLSSGIIASAGSARLRRLAGARNSIGGSARYRRARRNCDSRGNGRVPECRGGA
jgi:predicted DNA-binding helix-hairpin-helix protein